MWSSNSQVQHLRHYTTGTSLFYFLNRHYRVIRINVIIRINERFQIFVAMTWWLIKISNIEIIYTVFHYLLLILTVSVWIFIIQGFRTIVFIFIAIFTTFWPMSSPAFFRCFLTNSGAYTELRSLRNQRL